MEFLISITATRLAIQRESTALQANLLTTRGLKKTIGMLCEMLNFVSFFQVFFLAGLPPGDLTTVTRTCTAVPCGVPLFFPILNLLESVPDDGKTLRNISVSFFGSLSISLSFSILHRIMFKVRSRK